MLQEQLQNMRAWFKSYIKSFYNNDALIQEGIEFKEKHTKRVCANIFNIGRSLNLVSGDLCLAEAVALLHDVGRFRQYTLYRTFNDRRTENHALMGLQDLAQAGVLKSLDREEQNIINKAIECHNMCELPENMSGRCLLFARLIRDADKLDILEEFARHYTSQKHDSGTVLGSGRPDTPGYSEVLAKNLLEQKRSSYASVINNNDMKLLQLSWLYDINFPFTLAEILTKGYIEKFIGTLPDTAEIRAAGDHLQAYAKRRRAGAENLE